MTVEDLLSMSNNTFCSNVTIELKSNCDEGVARIMIVQIDVQGVLTVKISLLGESGNLLPNGDYTVSIRNIFTSEIDQNDGCAICLPTNFVFLFHKEMIGDDSQITTVQWFPGNGNGIVDVATILIELIVLEDCFDAGNLFVLACCEPGILCCNFQVGVLESCLFNCIEPGYEIESLPTYFM